MKTWPLLLLVAACSGARPPPPPAGPPPCAAHLLLGESEPKALAADRGSGLLLAGEFTGTLRFGDRAVSSEGGTDVFVARLTDDGTPRWMRRLGGAGNDRASAVALAPDGDVIAVGQTEGHCFVARLAGGDGRERFVVRLTGNGQSMCPAVALDPAGAIWIAGFFSGSLAKVASKGSHDIFVSRLSPADGTVQWTGTWGGQGNDIPRAIAVRPNGEVIVGGQFGGESPVERSEVDFGRGPVRSQGDFDAFLLALGPDGRTRWVTTFGDNGDDEVSALALGPGGEIFASGHLQPHGDYHEQPAHDVGNYTAFLAAFDQAGKRRWMQRFGGASSAGNAIALDDAGRVWTSGPFKGTLRAGALSVTSEGGFDVFAAAVDPRAAGAPFSVAKSFGSPAMDIGRAIAQVPGGVALAGFTRGELVACNRPLGSGGLTGFVIAIRGPAVH